MERCLACEADAVGALEAAQRSTAGTLNRASGVRCGVGDCHRFT